MSKAKRAFGIFLGLGLSSHIVWGTNKVVSKEKRCETDPTVAGCWHLQTPAGGDDKFIQHNHSCEITRNDTLPSMDNMTLILDPCINEDKRLFMECVLHYEPDPTKHDNKGTCLCYRDWIHGKQHTPAYNHSLNWTMESEDWFIYNSTINECVVKEGKHCAPVDASVTPYQCERDLRCVKEDPTDPVFRVCSKTSSFFLTWAPFSLVFILLLLQIS